MVVFLLINLIWAVLYGIWKAVRKESVCAAVFFLFLPGLGIVLYFLPQLLQRLFFAESYDRESLVRRLSIERMAEHPDMKSELSVVPIEDAMAVSENSEKRDLLLKQLKKGLSENYKTLLAAENDRDSESVHYVAAAKMEVYRIQQQKWTQSFKAYEENPDSEENFRNVCASLREFIDGRVLSAREQKMYKKKYCLLVEEKLKAGDGMAAREDCEAYLTYCVELEEWKAAEKFWNEHRNLARSETCYEKMIEMFYRKREKEKFSQCLKELREEKEIRLSAQGLNRLRYWMQRE